MVSAVSVRFSFLSVTLPVNVTLSPSLSASIWLEVITIGPRASLSDRGLSAPAATRKKDATINRLFLKHRFDIVLHHERTHIHIRRYTDTLKVDFAAEQFERVRSPDDPLPGFPEKRIRRKQVAVVR